MIVSSKLLLIDAGLFTVASLSYLISITNRSQVAQIRGKPIYVVTGVAIIPLASFADANKAIEQTKQSQVKESNAPSGTAGDVESSDDEDEHAGYFSAGENEDDVTVQAPKAEKENPVPKDDSSVAQDVIGRKGQYGRFAERWFSKKGWTVEKKRLQGMSADAGSSGERTKPSADNTSPSKADDSPAEQSNAETVVEEQSTVAIALLPKLLRTTRMLLGSKSFFFSYDLDITRRLGTQTSKNTELPLSRLVDPLVRYCIWLILTLLTEI